MTDEPKRGRGRPPKPIPKLDATAEEVARAMFAAATPPDPLIRQHNRKTSTKPAPENADG